MVHPVWETRLSSFPISFGDRFRQRELGSAAQPGSFVNHSSIFSF